MLLLSVIVISFSLRAPITAIGSLVGLIREDTGLNNGLIGLITTLPLVAFAVCSPFISRLSRKYGLGNMVAAGLFFIVVGGLIRSYTGTTGLMIGTIMIGIGISVANVLIPSIVKWKFPEQVGVVTGIYITSMAVFASIGAGISYPLAEGGIGWKASAASWAILGIIAFVMWLPFMGLRTSEEKLNSQSAVETTGVNIWKSPLAWYITLFMGFQSLNFYSLTAWIPSILLSFDLSPEKAGYMALLFQLAGVPSSFGVPVIAAKVKSQLGVVLSSISAYIAGFVILFSFHSDVAIVLSLVLLANGGAASFSWCMAMLSIKGKDPRETIMLSGMAQSGGYFLAAIGPALGGLIFDISGSWTGVMFLFYFMTGLMIVTGILASKKDHLFE